MLDVKQDSLDESLRILIEDKPSSRIMLEAAWDGLTPETQIKILSILRHKLPKAVRNRAISHGNPYIRYLASRDASFNEKCQCPEDILTVAKIASDNEVLVKYSRILEQTSMYRLEHKLTPELFFSLAHEARLLLLSHNITILSRYFKELIEWAIENGSISQVELDELTEEFLKNKSALSYFEPKPYEGYESYLRSDLLRDLWLLIPKLGKTESAYLLAEHLPTKDGLVSEVLNDEVLEKLGNNVLYTLFCRSDVELKDCRKKVVLSTDKEKYNDFMRDAAMTRDFGITPEDFHGLIINERYDVLKSLMFHNGHEAAIYLTPVYLEALNEMQDIIFTYDYDYPKSLTRDEAIEAILRKLPDWKRKRELVNLGLYYIARNLVPWDKREEPSKIRDKELHFLENKVVPGDTWATYIAFSKIKLSDSEEKLLLEDMSFIDESLISIPPSDPDDLFGKAGNDQAFIPAKLDFLYNEIIKLSKAQNAFTAHINQIIYAAKYIGIGVVAYIILDKAVGFIFS